ncbi:FecR family protein [Chitinophaga sp. Ak27]|uniref:FecR family protein n=1 Tax=Chitinophaga sp. Ak27 TaxID=2726116 RepID=UPI00145F75CD|nr:FecR domain-containing protein [Chitinophaga sp. Ak27]NLU96072.1 DUF4974 domain-containing protein [Chitinophaga sp. Ak27]
MEEQSRLNFLTEKVIDGSITAAEREEWWLLLADPEAKQAYEHLFNTIADTDGVAEDLFSNQEAAVLLDKIKSASKEQEYATLEPGRVFPLKLILSWSAAAVTLTTFSLLSYFFLEKDARSAGTTIVRTEQTIRKAPFIQTPSVVTLTLSDGKQVTLDSTGNSQIFTQPGAHAVKSKTGVLTYEEGKEELERPAVAFNTLTTPRGKTYKVVLPDGSQVWLNAASSLHYPTRFAGEGRKVELTGEAYFDIVKDADHPFIVAAGKQTIAVLGTAFNVKAYTDESYINTTLVEGSIKIDPQNGTAPKLLKPGEQAILENNRLQVGKVDIQQEISWKSDLFYFSNTDLQVVAHQLQRWYDIEVDFSTLPTKKLYGQLPRSTPLPQLLNAIEKTSNIKLKLTNHRLFAEQ